MKFPKKYFVVHEQYPHRDIAAFIELELALKFIDASPELNLPIILIRPLTNEVIEKGRVYPFDHVSSEQNMTEFLQNLEKAFNR